jgi:hydrogenase maturation protease
MSGKTTTLVVGLGSPDRGDDAVGPLVARRVAARGVPARVVEREDPTALLDLWSDVDLAVVVDAVRGDGPAGELVVLESGRDSAPLPEAAWVRTGRGGTHAFGLAAAVELARALRRLPPRVVLVGVTAGGFGYGEPLTDAVAAAVPRAVAAVVGIVAEAPDGTRSDGTRSDGTRSDIPRPEVSDVPR